MPSKTTNSVRIHTKENMPMNHRRNGFTLTELLVVIGISGILAGLLMAAATARGVRSTNNHLLAWCSEIGRVGDWAGLAKIQFELGLKRNRPNIQAKGLLCRKIFSQILPGD